MLGIVEGYFGTAWSWSSRTALMRFLAAHGYGFFIYAPKADPYLRRRWREEYPAAMAQELAAFATACRAAGVRFGIGLSPFESYFEDDSGVIVALERKLRFINEIGIDDLALLFDDMRGDLPDLAKRQVRLTQYCAARTSASRVLLCPSYYSNDPILDRVFGARPSRYLETLGAGLDPSVEIFWTGERICSTSFDPMDLARVAGMMRRKPFLWDNYPVNDGPRMSQHLHLRAFAGRPASLRELVAGHAINPALQPMLSRIPALTLRDSYRLGDGYDAAMAFAAAAQIVLGPALAAMVTMDLPLLQDAGLDKIGPAKATLRARYATVEHDAAREIVTWLDDGYGVSAEMVQTQ